MGKDFRTNLAVETKIQKLHRLIADGDYLSAQQLADALEVSRRTAVRYLDALRDQGAPLEYDGQKRGWFFKDPFWQLPPMKITEGDLLAFFIAEQSLRFTGQDEFAQRLRTSLARLATLLPEHVSLSLAELSTGMSFQTLPFAAADSEILDTITRASLAQKVIEFDYFSPHKQEVRIATMGAFDPEFRIFSTHVEMNRSNVLVCL